MTINIKQAHQTITSLTATRYAPTLIKELHQFIDDQQVIITHFRKRKTRANKFQTTSKIRRNKDSRTRANKIFQHWKPEDIKLVLELRSNSKEYRYSQNQAAELLGRTIAAVQGIRYRAINGLL